MEMMTKAQLINALRKDIIGEQDAIIQYDAHYYATDEPAIKAVWKSIRDEERVHLGELMTALTYLDPHEAELLKSGEKEALELIRG